MIIAGIGRAENLSKRDYFEPNSQKHDFNKKQKNRNGKKNDIFWEKWLDAHYTRETRII